MRNVRLLTLVFCLLPSAPKAQVVGSGGALRDALLSLSNQFMAAWQKHDAAALSGLLAPEFVYVGPAGPIPRFGVVNDLSQHCTLASYRFGEPRMLSAGADAAVLIYTVHSEMTCFGQADPPDVVNTDMFVRRHGRWLLLMTTSSTLVAPPAR